MAAFERPIGIDLFAGAGGLSLGFEQAGFDIAAAIEIDPVHAAVHEFNFPNCITICESVTDLTGEAIRKRARLADRKIDVVFGGAPCQGFSMIGKRALDDPRNSLVRHFVRLVVELDATYFVFENVKGLTLGKHRIFLEELIESFKKNGYDIEEPYRVLNAAHFGVPQDRKRLFLIGCKRGHKLTGYPIPRAGVTVREAIGDLPDADQYGLLLETDTVKAKYGKGSHYAQQLRGLLADPDDFSYPRISDSKLLTSSTRTRHSELSRSRFEATLHGETEPISRFHRLNPNGVCNTLRAGTDSARGAFTSPRPIHPFLSRVITVREAARLHSYPDWFRFHVTKWHGFREIGNSVPPTLARSVASQIVKALGHRPRKPKFAIELGPESLLKFDMSNASRYFLLKAIPISTRRRRIPEGQYPFDFLNSESKYA